jgi:predicted phage-related endonuclease
MKLIKVKDESHFLELHRSVIGASSVPAIMREDKWRSPYDVYCILRGLVPNQEPNCKMVRGQQMESHLICGDKFSAEKMIGVPIETGWFGISDRIPMLGCQFDGLTFSDARKITSTVEAKMIFRPTENDWGPSFTDEVPNAYNIQCQVQRLLAQEYNDENLPVKSYLYASIAGEDRIYDIPYNQQLIDAIITAVTEFKRRLDEHDPPPLSGTESEMDTIKQLYPETTGEVMECPESLLFAVESWQKLMAEIKKTEEIMQGYKNIVADRMKTAAKLTGPFGSINFTPRSYTAWAKIAKELKPPEKLVADNTTTTRTLVPYWKKEKE